MVAVTLAGFSTADPWANLDGRAGAPSGTAQYPNLLNSYPSTSPPNARVRWPNSGTQSPWEVAGVDYAVGVDSGVSLTDWASISIAGVTVNHGSETGASNSVTVTGTGITINGFDFTLHGGALLDYTGGDNLVVSNCKFGLTQVANPTNSTPACSLQIENGGAIIVTKCQFVGGNINTQFNANATESATSTTGKARTITYCWFNQCGTQAIGPGGTGASPWTIQFNLFDNCGTGSTDLSAHDDIILNNPSSTQGNIVFNFNTIRQTQAQTGGAGSQGVCFNQTSGPAKVNGFIQFENNTGVFTSSAAIIQFLGYDLTCTNGVITVSQNYFDPTGLQSTVGLGNGHLTVAQSSGGPYSGTLNAVLNNINMLDGTAHSQYP